jgi:hypothetical protein
MAGRLAMSEALRRHFPAHWPDAPGARRNGKDCGTSTLAFLDCPAGEFDISGAARWYKVLSVPITSLVLRKLGHRMPFFMMRAPFALGLASRFIAHVRILDTTCIRGSFTLGTQTPHNFSFTLATIRNNGQIG